MDSPSRNPLLQNEQDEILSSDEESQESVHSSILESNTYLATSTRLSKKEKKSLADPEDKYNFSFIVFYLLGM